MKGGVGKTTSVVEIATILVKEHRKRVLIIDLDPQTNATFSFMSVEDWDKYKDNSTIADVLGMHKGYTSRANKNYDINKAIIKNVLDINGLDLIPSHLELTYLDLELGGVTGREYILKNKIESVKENYDYILIDCPPNLTLAPQNALMISDYIIVPVVPEIYPAIGLPLLINRVRALKCDMPNCTVEFLGVIFTKVKSHTRIHTQQRDAIRKSAEAMEVHVFDTIIPETVRISEAVASSKPAYLVNRHESGIQAYVNLAKEIVLKIEENEKQS